MVDIKQLNVVYPGGNTAISDLTFRVQKGQRIALVGANGAGKSTLLMSLVGIIQPVSGDIVLDGLAVTKKNLDAIRAKAGVVFQNPDDQLFMTSVYDDVAFGPRNYGLSDSEVEKRVLTALSSLGIDHLSERMPHRLSGGEKRSVALASVLAMEPTVLLLDEPSSFLDPRARRKLIGVLSKLPLTQIIATHDLDMALEFCDRVLVLKEGRLRADGRPNCILTDEALLEECGLELPLSCGVSHRGTD